MTDTSVSLDQKYLLYASISPVVHLVNVERSRNNNNNDDDGDDNGVSGGNDDSVRSIANVTDIHEALDFRYDSFFSFYHVYTYENVVAVQ